MARKYRRSPNGQSRGRRVFIEFDESDQNEKAWIVAQRLATNRRLKDFLVRILASAYDIDPSGQVQDSMYLLSLMFQPQQHSAYSTREYSDAPTSFELSLDQPVNDEVHRNVAAAANAFFSQD